MGNPNISQKQLLLGGIKNSVTSHQTSELVGVAEMWYEIEGSSPAHCRNSYHLGHPSQHAIRAADPIASMSSEPKACVT